MSYANADKHYPGFYHNRIHSINNIATIVLLPLGNYFLARYVLNSSRRITNQKAKHYVRKKQFIVQLIVISSLVTICSAIYVYMQFFYTPTWLIFIGTLTFLLSSGEDLKRRSEGGRGGRLWKLLGALGFTYLIFNPTLREATKQLCRIRCRRRCNRLSGSRHKCRMRTKSSPQRTDLKLSMINTPTLQTVRIIRIDDESFF